ncbi:response regulator transcription factor [Halomonas qinghailakensis]|uniref:Response regulator transcription factor n=1 Tax=Halomonas qinghailakensis TaxID=2937790 RepID=A0AA46TMI3_9GAMM|nr:MULTISPECIES: response regulator transcription factor [Halomonas]UYO73111.1 response regulator transcription factor [Halomonas sp. ZZQ-149]
MRMLLIEDHPALAEAVASALVKAGFAVDNAYSANSALAMHQAASYDLVLLDLGLPDGNGLDLLPSLSANGQTPIVVLTARDQLSERLAGLDSGADDYIVKPVEMPELIARCRAILRRPGKRINKVLTYGLLAFDTSTRTATVGDIPLPLGQREIGVLEQLMRAQGQVLSREALEASVYSFDDEVGPNALEAAISRLRRALKPTDCELTIVTIRGVGWMLIKEQNQ